jgi:hypothetical protein
LSDQEKPQILLIILEDTHVNIGVRETRFPVNKSNAADLQITASHGNKTLRSLVVEEEKLGPKV